MFIALVAGLRKGNANKVLGGLKLSSTKNEFTEADSTHISSHLVTVSPQHKPKSALLDLPIMSSENAVEHYKVHYKSEPEKSCSDSSFVESRERELHIDKKRRNPSSCLIWTQSLKPVNLAPT